MFRYEHLQRDVSMHLAKPLCSQHLQLKAFMLIYILYYTLLQHVIVPAVDLAPIWSYHALNLYMRALFKFANLLKTEFVSLYIPVVTVWVKIAAPNCHGKSRYGCDMK